MAVPTRCTVLVIGGGPAGSYAAAALAREGTDTVLLEADKFLRYHIGESTLPSLHHFFKFIDFDYTINAHGFFHKNGAVFRLNHSHPEAYTDFLAAGGPSGYAWNLVRSEADDLLFKHAGLCGAHIFDETKVDTIQFTTDSNEPAHSPGRPTFANWVRKDGTSGTVVFDYLVDASGRYGIVSTKYLKNRRFNQSFKNVATWAYWKTDAIYGIGTEMEGSPYFEALTDGSGWGWFMPLHDGTRSVGVVQDQQIATAKRRQAGSPSAADFYKAQLALAPTISRLLQGVDAATEIRSASDYSYTASAYHLPHARICGDAGCFIDPLFSSGYHLAITGGLSAAVTTIASIKGQCDEPTAGSWHSKKTVESYTRFLLAVSSATKQIRSQEMPVIEDMDEQGFQGAFDLLQPIIQGTVDADAKKELRPEEIARVLEFCFKAFLYVPPDQKDALFAKLKKLGYDDASPAVGGPETGRAHAELAALLTPEETEILQTLRSRRMIREDPFEMDSFALDAVDGLAPHLERGRVGLVPAAPARIDAGHFSSPAFLDGRRPGIREGTTLAGVRRAAE